MRLEEFDIEKAWWGNRHESEQSWKVTADEIARNNYNLDIKNPNAPIEVHDDPEELIRLYREAVISVNNLQEELKALLQKSLNK